MTDTATSKNWAGNISYSSKNVYYPESVEEVRQIVKNCSHLTALGSRHSFNGIADNTENQICLEKMNKIARLDNDSNTVTIEAGIRYSELAPYLHEQGYALQNMASLPHITVAGAIATATHGSGLTSGNLSSAVVALEIVTANGDIVTLSRQDGDEFYGAVVALGALGIVTKVTLEVRPTFMMKQVVYRNLPMAQLQNNFDDLQSKGYSVSLFTDWKNKNINEVWIISKVDQFDQFDHSDVTPDDLDLYGLHPATEKTHPVEGQSTDPVTEQLGIPGPWFERMPHFKVGYQPSMGNELQSEYFVPVEHAYAAMMALEELHERISPHLYISEIRTIGADSLWMSPCYKQKSVAIHMTWIQQPEVVMELIPLVEEKLAPFNPIPHWAKLFTMTPAALQSRFEKLEDFKGLVHKYDPQGKFRNDFLNKNIFN